MVLFFFHLILYLYSQFWHFTEKYRSYLNWISFVGYLCEFPSSYYNLSVFLFPLASPNFKARRHRWAFTHNLDACAFYMQLLITFWQTFHYFSRTCHSCLIIPREQKWMSKSFINLDFSFLPWSHKVIFSEVSGFCWSKTILIRSEITVQRPDLNWHWELRAAATTEIQYCLEIGTIWTSSMGLLLKWNDVMPKCLYKIKLLLWHVSVLGELCIYICIYICMPLRTFRII